jgi:uncharacterized protein (TIGR03437 family)
VKRPPAFVTSHLFLLGTAALLVPAPCLSQTFTTLASFRGPNYPVSGTLVQGPDGDFYGTTGGFQDCGTIFKITSGGPLTTLHTMSCAYDGAFPLGRLILATDGNFYGTAFEDGPLGGGVVFQVTANGTLSVIYGFHSDATIFNPGNYPATGVIQASDGNFYGTTSFPEPYGALIFKLTPGGVFSGLVAFPGGSVYPSGLVQGRDGNFYGTTQEGTFFRFTPPATLTTLYSFSAFGPDGFYPYAGIMLGTDGNFYGTTETGGNLYRGTVFRITPSGTLTTIYSFSPSEGNAPLGGLVQGSDGNFYGMTSAGGNGYGTIFRITPGGVLTTLHTFAADGSEGSGGNGGTQFAAGSLIQGTDGSFYGTTPTGGIGGSGTVFRLQLPAVAPYVCSNGAPPVIASVDSASAYGGYPYFASGSWLEIKGTNMADPNDPRLSAAMNPGQWTSADFNGSNAPTSLDGISVAINGKPAYVWYLSTGQLNVQAPEDSATGNVAITVTDCNATSPLFTFARRAFAPGFLAPTNYTANGTQYMVATFQSDGAYVLNTTTGTAFGLNSRPAKPGDGIIAYGIGFGNVTPSILPGVIAGASTTLVNPVTISFASSNAAIAYQGLAGGFVGLYEFYFTVPSTLANGDYQVNVTQNGTTVPQTMYLTVHN